MRAEAHRYSGHQQVRRKRTVAGVLVLAYAGTPGASVLAQIGTPPPFFCGRTYVFAKAVPNGNVVSNQDALVRVNTRHFLNLVNAGGNCPAGTHAVSMSARLECDAGADAGPFEFGPFALNEGLTAVPIDVPVAAGPARLCTLIVDATVTFTDGVQVRQSGDQQISVQDPPSGNPNIPTITLTSEPGDGVVNVHPGDQGVATFTITNHSSDTVTGTLGVEMRNAAGTPEVLIGQNDTAHGVFSVADPGGGDTPPVRLALGNQPIARIELNALSHLSGTQSDWKPVVLAPGESITGSVATRTYPVGGHGAMGEAMLLFGGTSGAEPHVAGTAGLIVVSNRLVTPQFNSPPDHGRTMTGFSTTTSGIGPAAGLQGAVPSGPTFRVNFGLHTSEMQMLINGEPISSGTPNFSGVTQVDGEHVRLVSEFSFITPQAQPNDTITLITPIDVRANSVSASTYQFELHSLQRLAGVPNSHSNVAPAAMGLVNGNSLSTAPDVTLQFVHQISAVGVEDGTFNQVPMTNLCWDITMDGPGRYTVQSTWVAKNPGTTPMIGFDVQNDFRATARPGDFDGDGVPNAMDSDRFVFNPGGNLPMTPVVDQVDWYGGSGAPTLLNSDYGMFGVTLPNVGDNVLFVNAEINGDWHIRNMPISRINNYLHSPFESYFTLFEIGPAGVDVTGTAASVKTTVTKAPLEFGVPAAAPALGVTIGSIKKQMGDGEKLADAPPAPAAGAGAFERPAERAAIETATRPKFNMVDLNEPGEKNACGPGAVASSFVWLNRTYTLGQPDDPDDPEATKNTVLEEIKTLMDFDPASSGVASAKLFAAKKAYIAKHKLPLTVEGQGRGVDGAAIDPAELFKQMKRGQDVEVFIRWGGADFNSNGHYAPLAEMKKEGDTYTVTTHDDGDQEAGGGNDRRLSGQLVQEGGEWFYTDAVGKCKLVSWYAESPTKAAINRAVTNAAEALRALIDGLGGGATLEQGQEIIRRAFDLEYLVGRLKDNIDLDGSSTQEQKDQAEEMVRAARDIKDLSAEIPELSGGAQTKRLDQTRDAAQRLAEGSNALRSHYPPDADDDDVPDDVDNAPNDANPDQADCNSNGIGDVLELDGNDCNNNGIPDDCDIAEGRSRDINHNGVPDECERIGDLDGDGDVDLADVRQFFDCFGQFVSPGDPCEEADLDGNGFVNLNDWALMAANLHGPG